jgi:predicted nucleic acid-binding protein
MSDSVFLDTNVLVYAYSDTELKKQTVARKLVSENNSFISTQVLQELSNILHRKFKKTWTEIANATLEVSQSNQIHENSVTTLHQAYKMAERYKFSFYDSLIVAAALEANCSRLYSEDMNHNQQIEGRLTIVNPFLSR